MRDANQVIRHAKRLLAARDNDVIRIGDFVVGIFEDALGKSESFWCGRCSKIVDRSAGNGRGTNQRVLEEGALNDDDIWIGCRWTERSPDGEYEFCGAQEDNVVYHSSTYMRKVQMTMRGSQSAPAPEREPTQNLEEAQLGHEPLLVSNESWKQQLMLREQ